MSEKTGFIAIRDTISKVSFRRGKNGSHIYEVDYDRGKKPDWGLKYTLYEGDGCAKYAPDILRPGQRVVKIVIREEHLDIIKWALGHEVVEE